MTTIDQTPDQIPDQNPVNSRRWLLRGGGLALAAAFVAACGDDDSSTSPTTSGGGDTTTTEGDESTTTAPEGGGDLAVASLAASLEVLAVNTYGAALDAATSGALGEVPPAVANFVTTAMAQHQDHLDAWNGVLSAAGEPEVTDPPADLEQMVNTAFGEVTDVTGAAELALLLEETAAATYQSAIPSLESEEAISTAGSILCIDRQHAAVLRFVLGEYPIPDVFGPLDKAYSG